MLPIVLPPLGRLPWGYPGMYRSDWTWWGGGGVKWFYSQSPQLLLLDNPLTKSAMAKKGSSNLERRFDRRSFEVPASQKSRNQVVVRDCQALEDSSPETCIAIQGQVIAMMSEEVAQSRRTAYAAMKAMSAMSKGDEWVQPES